MDPELSCVECRAGLQPCYARAWTLLREALADKPTGIRQMGIDDLTAVQFHDGREPVRTREEPSEHGPAARRYQ